MAQLEGARPSALLSYLVCVDKRKSIEEQGNMTFDLQILVVHTHTYTPITRYEHSHCVQL